MYQEQMAVKVKPFAIKFGLTPSGPEGSSGKLQFYVPEEFWLESFVPDTYYESKKNM